MSEQVRNGDQWIDDSEGLEALAHDLSNATRLAIDTEANSFHAYRPRLCLIQVAFEIDGRVRVALVDCLALENGLGELGNILHSAEVETILHGADNDVRLLHRDSSVAVRGLFDTQIAAKLLGEKRTGLAALAELCLDLRISKSGQRLDWGRRPLPPAARRYAADDARILFEIRDQLAERLSKAGRMDWAREEFALLEGARFPPEKAPSTEDLVARISGSSRLDSRTRAVLWELALWRENEARRRGVPPVHIVPPRQLAALAHRRGRGCEELARAGVSPRIIQRYGKALLAALSRGLDAPPVPRSESRRSSPEPPGNPRPGLVSRLKALRTRKSAELGLDEGTVWPTGVLKAIARELPRSCQALLDIGMRRWQADLLGDEVWELLDEGEMHNPG